MSTAIQLRPELPAAPVPSAHPHPALTLIEGTPSCDDALVAQALRRGDASARAVEELYRRHRAGVARVAASFSELDPDEVEDVVQESFVRAFRALGALKEPGRFAAWLCTIARNRARSYLSSRATHAKAAEEATREATLAEGFQAPASHQLEREIELRAVREIIAGLREGPEKETVRLFYLEGALSAREIAQRMGVGKSAVTMRLERFRTRVRKELISRCAG
ncbi:MAG: sigma-70 family RNA polymerase sigma factor [Myxococcales bacterium]